MIALDFAVDALATARITRLITRDTILRVPRNRLIRSEHEVGAEFITCPWCVSVWIGFGVLAARRVAPRVWGPVAVALACSEVAGVIAEEYA